jgi:hypothetical protein
VLDNVEKKTGKTISLRTIQRTGKKFSITSKRERGFSIVKVCNCSLNLSSTNLIGNLNIFVCLSVGTENYRNSVITFRRKCQRVAKKSLVFIDGSGLRSEPRKLTGLALSGKKAKSTTKKAEKYEPRVDVFGAISFNGPLTCETVTSSQRKQIINARTGKKGVKGYTKNMVKKFLKKQLAPEIKAMGVKKVIVCMDKGLAFKEEEAKQQLQAGGAMNVDQVWILPTNIAKHVSPLDNSLWRSLKERVRKRKPTSELQTARFLKEEFMAISPKDIHSYFTNCKLTCQSDPNEGLD